MPAATAPLDKNQQIGGNLGAVVEVVLALKNVGASDDIVSKALSGSNLPSDVRRSAETLSKGIKPDRYGLDAKYPPQLLYPSD